MKNMYLNIEYRVVMTQFINIIIDYFAENFYFCIGLALDSRYYSQKTLFMRKSNKYVTLCTQSNVRQLVEYNVTS